MIHYIFFSISLVWCHCITMSNCYTPYESVPLYLLICSICMQIEHIRVIKHLSAFFTFIQWILAFFFI